MPKLRIKKYVNKNNKSKGYGKTYGRIAHQEMLTTLDVAKHIQKHGSIFTSDVVVGVLQRFSLCIEELLQDGYKVKLDGLGTFYLSVKTTGEEDPEEFSTSNIKQVRIKFLADKSKKYDWNAKSQTLRAAFSILGEDTSSSTTGGDDSGNSGSDNQGGGDDQPIVNP